MVLTPSSVTFQACRPDSSTYWKSPFHSSYEQNKRPKTLTSCNLMQLIVVEAIILHVSLTYSNFRLILRKELNAFILPSVGWLFHFSQMRFTANR